MDIEEQKAKEEVVKQGITKGLALFSRDNKILGKDVQGGEIIITEFADPEKKWQKALESFSDIKDDLITTEKQRSIKIFTDGGSRGNPGPSASGYVIMTDDDQILEEGGEYLGITTNNQAEYQAVKLALQAAEKYTPETIRFYIDSLLVVNQMKGIYKIKNRDLWPIHSDIKQLSENYKTVKYIHVRREFNKLADGKVNEVLDSRES